MIDLTAILGLPGYEVTGFEERGGEVGIAVRFTGEVKCPECGGGDVRNRDRRTPVLRHDSLGRRRCVLELETHKWQCRNCGRTFWHRFPGILPRRRATEPYRRTIFERHWDGISRRRLAQGEGIGSATVERWFLDFLGRLSAERKAAPCPRILGIDEHFFTRRYGYATTFCDLRHHSVYDVVPGRSEAALERYLMKLEGKAEVELVCLDLSSSCRVLVKKHFPNAQIVADRFHVIRVVNHHFLAGWRQLDPIGSEHRGLLSLMRRHRHNLRPEQQQRLSEYLAQQPVLEIICRFKQRLCDLLLKKHRTKRQCAQLVPRFLRAVQELRQSQIAALKSLGETLQDWAEEIVAMWRFTRNNGITEGFHTRMELMQRQACGFRNFANYRLRVKAMCSRACAQG